jgi:hypothetical protein
MKEKIKKNIIYWNGENENDLVRNCYDKENKRYWNDEKRKWVKYKLKDRKVKKNNKFYRYEFEYFGKKECELLFEEISCDRILKFIDLVYRRYVYNKSSNGLIKYLNGDFVRILIKDCEGIIGNNKINYLDTEFRVWEYVLRVLDDNEIIEVDWKGKSDYDKNKVLWWVRLDKKFIKCKKKRILISDISLIRYLERKNNKILEKLDKRNKWELECCKLLSIDLTEKELDDIIDKRYLSKKEEKIDRLKWEILSGKSDKSEKKKILNSWVNNFSDSWYFDYYDEEYKDILKKEFENFKDILNNIKKDNYENDRFFVNNEFDGRYYNIISNLNRDYRKKLKLDNEEIVEIDIRNSYISLFFCLVGFLVEYDKERSFSIDVFKEIKSRCKGKWGFDFYNYYNDFVFNLDKVDFYKIIGIKLFGVRSKKYSRNYIKEIVNRIINSSDLVLNKWNVNGLNIRDIKSRIFMDDGMEFIDELKSIDLLDIFENVKNYRKYKNLNILVGRLESEVMRRCMDILIDNNIKFISLFDSFLLRKVDVDKVLYTLNEVLKLYGNKLKFKYESK